MARYKTVRQKELDALMERFGGKCCYCGQVVHRLGDRLGPNFNAGVVEHIEPLSRGGEDTPENRVLACAGCNIRKCNSLPLEWVLVTKRIWRRRRGSPPGYSIRENVNPAPFVARAWRRMVA